MAIAIRSRARSRFFRMDSIFFVGLALHLVSVFLEWGSPAQKAVHVIGFVGVLVGALYKIRNHKRDRSLPKSPTWFRITLVIWCNLAFVLFSLAYFFPNFSPIQFPLLVLAIAGMFLGTGLMLNRTRKAFRR